MGDLPGWVKPGAEVMEVSSSSWRTRYGRTLKIAKVYKNGNFTVEGGTGQWRPMREYAWAAGERRYLDAALHPVTQELIARAERARKVDAASKVVRQEADRLSRIRNEDELLASAAWILSRPTADAAENGNG